VTGEKVINLNPFFVKIAKKENFWSEDLVEKIKANKGSLKGLKEISEKIQQLFSVAADIPYEAHIKMQAAFQKAGVDSAVSKTINMSPEVIPQDVIQSYLLAYNEGCKGVTIYRDRSRQKQVLERDENYQDGKKIYFRQLPEVRRGSTWALTTPVGTLHATINEDKEGNPLETFFNVGKAGGDILAIAEGLGRLISLDLRTTSPKLAIQKLQMIVEQLSGIGSSFSVGFGTKRVRSLPDGIAKILQNYLNEKKFLKNDSKDPQGEDENSSNHQNHGNLCPQCGNATLIYEEGCEKCNVCGYSKC
jgi:ribonucleoside-diphosphate reductase alpha chain